MGKYTSIYSNKYEDNTPEDTLDDCISAWFMVSWILSILLVVFGILVKVLS